MGNSGKWKENVNGVKVPEVVAKLDIFRAGTRFDTVVRINYEYGIGWPIY